MKQDASDIRAALADAALAGARKTGWDRLALRDLAEEAGLELSAVYGVVRSKDDVLATLMARFDRAAPKELDLERDADVRERVFDAAMARFDAMEPHRAGLADILGAERARAGGAARAVGRLIGTARWILEMAGEDTSGFMGAARARGFALVIARAERAWLDDTAGDLSRTMRQLDKDLRDIADWRARLKPGKRDRSEPEAGPDSSGDVSPGSDDGADDAPPAPGRSGPRKPETEPSA